MIHKCLINTGLYLTFLKYVDKLDMVQRLINILKFAYFNAFFYSFFRGYLRSNKSFNKHALMLAGTFIDGFVWGLKNGVGMGVFRIV